jgi:hypothetical protein
MIPFHLQLFSICIALILLLLFYRAIKKKQLLVKYTILWFFICFTMLFLAIFPEVFGYFSKLMGFELPVNTLFFLSIIFILLLLFQQTVTMSRLENSTRILAQRLAILEEKANREQDKNNSAA